MYVGKIHEYMVKCSQLNLSLPQISLEISAHNYLFLQETVLLGVLPQFSDARFAGEHEETVHGILVRYELCAKYRSIVRGLQQEL